MRQHPRVSFSHRTLSLLFFYHLPQEDAHKATKWHQEVCVIAEKYANQMHDKAVKEAAEAFNTAEDAQLKSYRVGGKYWARKRNNPTVNFPLKIANQLRVYYNEQNPHCSPDEAYTRLVGLPKYQHSLYVKYVIIPGKIQL